MHLKAGRTRGRHSKTFIIFAFEWSEGPSSMKCFAYAYCFYIVRKSNCIEQKHVNCQESEQIRLRNALLPSNLKFCSIFSCLEMKNTTKVWRPDSTVGGNSHDLKIFEKDKGTGLMFKFANTFQKHQYETFIQFPFYINSRQRFFC